MNLHNDIMNLPCGTLENSSEFPVQLAYKYGHRDARHAAAELALKADSMLEDYSDMIRKICFEYSAGGYNSEGLLPVATAEAKLRWIIEDVRTSTEWLAASKQKEYDKVLEEAVKIFRWIYENPGCHRSNIQLEVAKFLTGIGAIK